MDNIFQSIELLSKEKGIDPQIVFDAVKDAMLVAARKHFRTTEDLVADLEDRSQGVRIFAVYKVVEEITDPIREMTLEQARRSDPAAEVGQEIRIFRSTESLGRISAQTAKQVILQKVREAERETVYAEYANRVGEMVNCAVKRMEGLDLLCDLGKTEARLPRKEQSKLENFSVGDRIRCVIKSVEKAGKNAGVLVSRAAPELVERLFEQEVPEIYDGTVLIRGCAREAGERTKIAVSSRDREVDSVGACVGMKGMRVQSIIRELRGEKIDIIEYSEDPAVFATHALSPAKITRVSILSLPEKHMEVIVDDSQLSLAIGKKGQNVRLASKLLVWRIDIKSEEEKRQEVESAMEALTVPGAPVSVLIGHGIAESIAQRLIESGIPTVEKLGAMTPEELEAAGMSSEMVESIQVAVNSYYGQFEVAPAEVETAAAADAEAAPQAVQVPEETVDAAEAPPAEAESPEPVEEASKEAEAGSANAASSEQAPGAEAPPSAEPRYLESESDTIKSAE
ncbi:MAG: transcription termination/antitermination protein NusA [Acidobacteria bacterium]|nr:transcription termination/antitermination protein NusA [Acidobacteriota bacterium]